MDKECQVDLPRSAHAMMVSSVLGRLQVSVEQGLSEEEANLRRTRFGANTPTRKRSVDIPLLLLHQFASPFAYLLAGAAALGIYTRHFEEAVAILVVLAINGVIGFATEYRAVRTMVALRALGLRNAKVRREGHVRTLSAEELVPGDIVVLEAGDAVPADVRLVEAAASQADESLLTGESTTVTKGTEPVAAEARLGDRTSMLHAGTTLVQGSAVGVVVKTAANTEIGRIALLTEAADPGSSPLERNLARLSRQLVIATFVIAMALLIVGVTGGRDGALVIQATIALAVAAIPEGLPIVATLALARGMWRMARQKALVERLSAVETLGATTVILTDKTGTLTENRMTVTRLCTADGELDLDDPRSERDPDTLVDDVQAMSLLRLGVLCNNAHLSQSGEIGSGDPMEIALLTAGLRAGLRRAALLEDHRLVRTEPFDPKLRMMATIHEHGDGFLVATKGAPEAILAACRWVISDCGEVLLTDALRAQWQARVETFGQSGLRVLACATKASRRLPTDPFGNLVLVGLIGLEDPIRADVPGSIQDCLEAGIRVVMVTGDHARTAQSVGRKVGLAVERTVEGNADKVIDAGRASLAEIGIFARISPADKLNLVRAYQGAGEVVAMTGDGVNDAPALRQANIGIAMGMRGTDAAREAAAMVLLDDAFPTIVKAIREGRVIFANIRRFVIYLLSCNLCEVLVVASAVVTGLPLPLLPLQILYLNLVTDIFPAFALALGEGEETILKQPPRNAREPILGVDQWVRIVLLALALVIATFAAMFTALHMNWSEAQVVTVSFLTLAFAQVWHTFNVRSTRARLLRNEVTGNPWVWAALLLCCALLAGPPYIPPFAALLGVTAPDPAMWGVVCTFSLAPLIVIQSCMLLLPSRRDA